MYKALLTVLGEKSKGTQLLSQQNEGVDGVTLL